MTYFNITDLSLKDNIAVLDASVWKGLKEGFKIVVMIFGAFTILNALKATGAIEDVKAAITQFSGEDRRAQLIIIGIFVPIFLEGNSIGREGDVLRITFRAFFIILIEYMIISMLYTYMIFPGFGL